MGANEHLTFGSVNIILSAFFQTKTLRDIKEKIKGGKMVLCVKKKFKKGTRRFRSVLYDFVAVLNGGARLCKYPYTVEPP